MALRRRDTDGDGVLDETLYYIQNTRGDVTTVLRTPIKGVDPTYRGDGGGERPIVVERYRYSVWGIPTVYAAADMNMDGVVDETDNAAMRAAVQKFRETPSRLVPRGDINQDGRVDIVDVKIYFQPAYQELINSGGNGREQLSYGSGGGVPEESQWYRGSDAYQQTHLDNRLGFAGYVWDPWLKVYHVRHRVYDPFDTRWLQADPIGYAGGDTDLRRYCNGDPINYIDPLGLCGGAGGTDEYWNNRHENRPGGTPDDTLHRSIITIIGTTNNLFGPQWNQKIDNGLNAVGSRLVGASRMCGGGAAGIGTGGLGAAFAADQIVAGARQVVTGEAADSALNQLVDNGLQGYGVDPDTAKTIANGSEIAAGLGLGIQQASRQAATRAAAEGAEAGASTGANAADDAAKAPSSGTGTTAAEKGGGAGKSPGQAGKEGEAMVPGKKNTDQIGSPSGDKKYRVPDRLDDEAKTLGEIKNVDKQSLTSQLRDYSAWAKENGYTAELWLRSDTKVSGPLQRAFDCGDIIRRDIPFTAPTAP